MRLLEYKVRELFNEFGIPALSGTVIDTADGLEEKIKDIKYPVVIKAQIQAGGRGKAGGIKFAENKKQAVKISRELLGTMIRGHEVKRLLIVEKIEISDEFYLSIMLDRLSKCPMIIFSPEGGVDIEQTARDNPDKIIKLPVEPLIGIKDYMACYIVNKSGIDSVYKKQLFQILKNLYKMFVEKDCLLAEINPLAVTEDGNLAPLDGKVDIDDSSLYRQPDILKFRDELEEEPLVMEARKYRFLYIPVDRQGNIAVMSNGSGMLMSCIDLITQKGMRVGAVLDLGGGATSQRVSEGIRIMLSHSDIKVLFINIFGGITRCDEIASGVEAAMKNQPGDKFVVIRLEGTNKDKGLEIINDMDCDITAVDGLAEGVRVLWERKECI